MIPKFYETMYPMLEFLSDGREHKLLEIYDYLAKYFNLNEEEKNETIPSGRQKRYINRINWGHTYLLQNPNYSEKSKALIKRVGRGIYQITDEGKEYVKDKNKFYEYLRDTFKELENKDFKNEANKKYDNEEGQTPEEKITKYKDDLNKDIKRELLSRILEQKPEFFENLILELFVKMGYAYENKAQLTGKGADGGIDGIIYEDELGLSKIYTQAKRYQEGNNISRSKIQEFAGMISEHKVTKGIFVTTSDFTQDALNSAKKHENIILVNGDKLLDLMIKFKVGVSVKETYEILEIDQNFFDDED